MAFDITSATPYKPKFDLSSAIEIDTKPSFRAPTKQELAFQSMQGAAVKRPFAPSLFEQSKDVPTIEDYLQAEPTGMGSLAVKAGQFVKGVPGAGEEALMDAGAFLTLGRVGGLGERALRQALPSIGYRIAKPISKRLPRTGEAVAKAFGGTTRSELVPVFRNIPEVNEAFKRGLITPEERTDYVRGLATKEYAGTLPTETKRFDLSTAKPVEQALPAAEPIKPEPIISPAVKPTQPKDIDEMAKSIYRQKLDEYGVWREGNILNRMISAGEKISIPVMKRNGYGGELEGLRQTLPRWKYNSLFTSIDDATKSPDIVAEHMGVSGTNELLQEIRDYEQLIKPKSYKEFTEMAKEVIENPEAGKFMLKEQQELFKPETGTPLFEKKQIVDKLSTDEQGKPKVFDPKAIDWEDIRGKTIKTSDDLPLALKSYRNPKVELLHFIYTDKEGKVLAHRVIGSKTPSFVALNEDPQSVTGKELLWKLENRIKKTNADKIHIVHNHPAGNAKLSETDAYAYRDFKMKLKDKLGEFISINHDHYYRIADYTSDERVGIERREISLLTDFNKDKIKLGDQSALKELIRNSGIPDAGKMKLYIVNSTRNLIKEENINTRGRSVEETGRIINERIKAAKGYKAYIAMSRADYSKMENDIMKLNNVDDIITTPRSKEITGVVSVRQPITSKNLYDESKTFGFREEGSLYDVKREMPPPPTVRGGITPPKLNFPAWKDKAQFSYSRETLERNLEDIAGADAEKVKDFLVNPIRGRETARVDLVNKIRKTLGSILKENKIKVLSKEDALIRLYGEGKISAVDMARQTNNVKGVVSASNAFRAVYDKLLDLWNGQRQEFGLEPIPKRADYFRHFEDIANIIQSFGVILRKDEIPTEIAGITHIFNPNAPFTTAQLRRKGSKTSLSSIRGMDNYLDSVSNSIFHIESLQRLKSVIKYMENAGDMIQLPHFMTSLREYYRQLAGKKAMVDRAVEDVFGRMGLSVTNTLRSQAGKNLILGNLSASLTNLIPLLTQFPATTPKKYVIAGLYDGIDAILKKDFYKVDGEISPFLLRRYPVQRIAPTAGENFQSLLGSVFSGLDRLAARIIVSAQYRRNIDLGMSKKEAMQKADSYAGKVIADRSRGNLPTMFGSRLLGIATQFQVEVNNMMSFIFKDIPEMARERKLNYVSAMLQFLVYSYAFNEIFEKVAGRKPTIDPIQYALTLLGVDKEDKDRPFSQRAVKAWKDISGNIPFVGSLSSGGRFPITSGIPNVPKMMEGKANIAREFIKPILFLLFPGGGLQLQKTIEGLASFKSGVVKTQGGQVTTPIEQTPQNLIRGALFGKSAFPESVEYRAEGRRPIGERETQVIERSKNKQAIYEAIQRRRAIEKKKREAREKIKR
jgi:hypothetical protein